MSHKTWYTIWEEEKIGVAIMAVGIFMLCFNRIHKYFPFLRCWPRDSNGGETERATLRYIPQSIDHLHSLTKFSKEELKTLYRNFKNDCPNGVVNEETLKNIYAQFFPDGDSDAYAHLIYKSFDRNNSGHVTFERFVVCLSQLLRGSLKDRLRWTFELYDVKGMGYINKDDVTTIIRSVYKLLGACTHPPISDERVLEHVERAFAKLDLNRVGKVDFDDFYEVCTKDETVVMSMGIFDHAM